MPDHCPHADHPADATPGSSAAPHGGKTYWRSLDELAQTPEFREYLEREFPDRASEWRDPVSRREFLKLMSASLALAGVAAGTTGCDSTQTPDENIVPYVAPPEDVIPGKPQYYATTFPFGGYGLGVLAESHTGRPTKIEGNPDHPASLGATDAFAQASVLSLYDPDRSRTIMRAGVTSTWNVFAVELRRVMEAKRKAAGKGLRILTDTVTSPTLTAQIQDLLKQFPEARWHRYEPVTQDNARQGARMAFGRPVQAVYRFENAERIVALDSDFSCFGPGGVRYAREFSRKRRVRRSNPTQEKPREAAHGTATMSRLYVVESTPTTTGAAADHRISLRASDIAVFARALAAQLGIGSAGDTNQLPPSISQEWLAALVKDLKEHNGRSLIVVGEYQPPEVHALVHAMNQALGAVGQTVVYVEPLEANGASDVESIRTLAEEMQTGSCDTLFIFCGNPAFTAPADVGFAERLTAFSNQLSDDKKTSRNFTVHLGQYYDETAFRCQWHLPESHYLEAWSDIRSFDGTVSIVQPLIAPLYQTRSTHEFLAAMLGQDVLSGRDIVRAYWLNQRGGNDFEGFWRNALQRGIIEGTASRPVQVALSGNFTAPPATQPATQGGYELIFRPDPTIWDGRYANNGWLQELPKPLTKITWDNVALISYRTSQQLGVGNGDLVVLQYKTRRLRIPVWILPGQPDGSITVHLGYGRTMGGSVAKERGFNAYQLRTTENIWFAGGVQVSKVGRKYAIATTQPHHLLTAAHVEARDLIKVHTLDEFHRLAHPPDKSHNAPGTGHGQTVHLSLYPEFDYSEGRAWGMSIDQTACMGCSACVVACQAENNIPVVGKEQVIGGREMDWLRIDTYYRGAPEDPDGPFFQPMLCWRSRGRGCRGC
jgi:molybdopterin-containing oxidoreductase family iron-sulfur binding subunit